MTELRMPKLNNNDDRYVLVEWLVADGDSVNANDTVATVETSKALEDFVCDTDGILRTLVPAGRQCVPGELIGRVLAPDAAELTDRPGSTADEGASESTVEPGAETGEGAAGESVITAPAARLMAEHGIERARVDALGLRIVRKEDVERLAAGLDSGAAPELHVGETDRDDVVESTTVQRAVARAVDESHRTIPAAYTVAKIDIGSAQQAARQAGRTLRTLVGLPELLIAAVARAFDRYPMLFATPAGGTAVRPADGAHIGVTIDAGRGLFVPVIRNAGRLDFADLVRQLAAHRQTAMFRNFRERDLQGANIVVTLHQESDIVIAIPMIFPGQLCALALTAPQRELTMDDAGNIGSRMVVELGLAYDHRFVNGREAILLLHAVKAGMEDPATLTGAAISPE